MHTTSTLNGEGNGLQAKVSGNKVAYRFVKKHPDAFLFAANEVADHPHAVKTIEKYLKKGGVMIGEQKFNVECDSPAMQKLYEVARHFNVPILMHFQYDRYNHGLDRMHTMLEKYPTVNFIGHAQAWWANIDKVVDRSTDYPKSKVNPGGITERLLSDYPNIYGDFSAGSGLNSLTRDEEHAKDFLKRHQDKLMFGSDCWDSTGQPAECAGARTIAAIKNLSPEKSIERKVLYENAKKFFRL